MFENIQNILFSFFDIFCLIYAIFDVKIAQKRQFCSSGPLWSTRVDHMCVILPNEVWGFVIPPKYHVR